MNKQPMIKRAETTPPVMILETASRLFYGQPLTPGMEYVEDFLGGMQEGPINQGDTEWIAQNIDEGFFRVCPRCHFLHLPKIAWRLGLPEDRPEPKDGCDICAFVLEAITIPFHYDNLREALANAPSGLAESRRERAQLLCDLWIGASQAADTWVLAAMQGAVSDLNALVQPEGEAAG